MLDPLLVECPGTSIPKVIDRCNLPFWRYFLIIAIFMELSPSNPYPSSPPCSRSRSCSWSVCWSCGWDCFCFFFHKYRFLFCFWRTILRMDILVSPHVNFENMHASQSPLKWWCIMVMITAFYNALCALFIERGQNVTKIMSQIMMRK